MNYGILILLIVTLALGVLFGGSVLWAGRPDLARIDLDRPGRLVVEPLGMMKFAGFHGAIDVPLSAVTGAEAVDPKTVPMGLKWGGSSIPGIMQAGTFRKDGTRRFFLVGKAQEALLISLTGEHYAQLVVQVADPAASARSVQVAAGVG